MIATDDFIPTPSDTLMRTPNDWYDTDGGWEEALTRRSDRASTATVFGGKDTATTVTSRSGASGTPPVGHEDLLGMLQREQAAREALEAKLIQHEHILDDAFEHVQAMEERIASLEDAFVNGRQRGVGFGVADDDDAMLAQPPLTRSPRTFTARLRNLVGLGPREGRRGSDVHANDSGLHVVAEKKRKPPRGVFSTVTSCIRAAGRAPAASVALAKLPLQASRELPAVCGAVLQWARSGCDATHGDVGAGGTDTAATVAKNSVRDAVASLCARNTVVAAGCRVGGLVYRHPETHTACDAVARTLFPRPSSAGVLPRVAACASTAHVVAVCSAGVALDVACTLLDGEESDDSDARSCPDDTDAGCVSPGCLGPFRGSAVSSRDSASD